MPAEPYVNAAGWVGEDGPVHEHAITVIGRDRPGIITDASGALVGLGLNLTDSTMTRRRGHFAMTLICARDRLGIVSAVTRLLADAGGNITDLTTRLTGDLYVLVAEVDLPSTVEASHIEARLRDLGVEANLRPADADLL